LDKTTLKEKKHFNSYIRPSKALGKHRNLESMKVNGISMGQIKNAPTLKDVIKKFDKTFGHNVIQAFYVGYNDKRFLVDAYQKSKIKYQFDYHYFELWGLFYPFLAKQNQLKSKKDFAGFGLQYLIKRFKIKVDRNTLHDASVDCRVEAEVLRKIMQKLK
jgi:DNA polymerase III epsilon subunit-like protein